MQCFPKVLTNDETPEDCFVDLLPRTTTIGGVLVYISSSALRGVDLQRRHERRHRLLYPVSHPSPQPDTFKGLD